MTLLSINVGMPREVPNGSETVLTAIFKTPVEGPVLLRRFNLDGDYQADQKHHGGADKAVYAYPFEHYDFWMRELGRDDFVYGQFGENFTVEGLLEDQVHIGDRFRIGEAVVEVSLPRIPCFKLELRMNERRFGQRLMDAMKTGFYFRVVQEGYVRAGTRIERIQIGSQWVSVQAIHRLYFYERQNEELKARALNEPALADAARQMILR